ncbi:catalase-like domain-containing protein [Daldinia sp. FL1419]|nr:catalase-like domain-containing protein [Daldinia sp. FL1419]
MPLPSDPKAVELGDSIVDELFGIYDPNPGIRPTYAKGILLSGKFSPFPISRTLSKAPHFKRSSVPVIVRFSSSTGFPNIPDTDPNGNPRGFAIRFVLQDHPRRLHTDIIAHSVDGFPASTGEEALEFFKAVKNGTMDDYLVSHPKALAFVRTPKPTPAAFGREKYYGVTAYKFIAEDGRETYIRYRIVPCAGEAHLDDNALKSQPPLFLYHGVEKQFQSGPILFALKAQIAEPGDITNDSTVKWPDDRQEVTLGSIQLLDIMENQNQEQRRIIFDPIPRVEGIEPSDDPLLDVRAAAYLLSGRERRGPGN